MRQATRRLLKMRPGARVISKVEYRPYPKAQGNQCYKNALAEQRRSGNMVIAGWIVGNYFKDADSTPIMFHFWNITDTGEHYDTTPAVADRSDQQFEFVEDQDVYFKSFEWSQENLDGDWHFPPALKVRSRSVNMCVREPGLGSPGKDFRWIDLQEQPITIEQMLNIRQMCMAN